jgi:hypothetical protein
VGNALANPSGDAPPTTTPVRPAVAAPTTTTVVVSVTEAPAETTTTEAPATTAAPPATQPPPTTKAPAPKPKPRPKPVAKPKPKPKPEPEPVEDPGGDCDPSYVGVCLDPSVSDYDCAGGSGNGPEYVEGPFKVVGSDPFDLDRDGDGVGCENG